MHTARKSQDEKIQPLDRTIGCETWLNANNIGIWSYHSKVSQSYRYKHYIKASLGVILGTACNTVVLKCMLLIMYRNLL